MNETEIDARLKAALQSYHAHDYPSSLREINEVLRYHPDHFRALFALANAARAGGSFGISVLAARRLLEIAPRNPDAMNCLGQSLDAVGEEDDALALFHASFEGSAKPVTALHIANIHANRCEPRVALEWFDRARELKGGGEPDENESFAHLSLRNWATGWEIFSRCVGSSNRPLIDYGTAAPWDGKATPSLIVYTDQGIGDEIMFASCLPDVRPLAKRVIIDCSKRMLEIYRHAFPWAEAYPTRAQPTQHWMAGFSPAHKIMISELPRLFRLRDEDFTGAPYLAADPVRRAMFRTLLDGINPVHPRRPKIGLAWTGGLPNTGRTRRSLTLDNLAPLIAEFPQADFVSLQYMDAPEAAAAGVHHFPFATQTKDYMDTAALVAELDLVITVQTAVVHLAGALGKACHVIVSNRPVWRYGAEGAAMPWYSSVVLHRQPAGGTWQVPIDSVIATVGRAIRNGDYLRKLPAAAGQAA